MNVYIINPVVLGFQMQISSIERFSLSILVKCCVYLSMSSSKTQMLPLEKNILRKMLTVLLYCRFVAFIFSFVVFCLSFVNNGWNNITTPTSNQCLWQDSGISVAESQTFRLMKCPPEVMSEEKRLVLQVKLLCKLSQTEKFHLHWWKACTCENTL